VKADAAPSFWDRSGTALPLIARNVGTRYLAIATEAVLGLVMLPYNVSRLGASEYGLWMIAGSITAYFSILDLGYGGALVKFVAQYRARRDAAALNEILSTVFVMFTGLAIVAWLAAAAIAWNLGPMFNLPAAQAAVGGGILLIIAAHIAAGLAFGVFGAVINGFQRYDLNNVVGTVTTILVAIVNVAMLEAGFGLLALVAATTGVRLVGYLAYRHNAYRVFPALSIRLSHFRQARLKELSSFSIFVLMLDWAAKVNYSIDAVVIGATLGTAAVAIWTVPQRLVEAIQRLSNQLNDVLFPTVVDSDTAERPDRLRKILVQGTRLSLAAVLPASVALFVLAGPVIGAWVGPGFHAGVPVAMLLAGVVAARVGSATAMTVLKGAGRHRFLAVVNLATAAANIALSLLLVRSLGLVGVALGTFIPVVATAALAVFPAGCRRVGLSVREGLAQAVWPAAWPALAMAGWLFALRPFVSASLLSVAAHTAVAALLYLALFLRWGLPGDERRFYVSKAAILLARLRRAEVTT
jgi:O-antigen/teichoic acid export membrane protein